MPTQMIRATQYSADLREALRCGRETEAQQLLGLLARTLVRAIAVDRPRVREAIRKGLGEAKPFAAMTDVEGHTTPRLLGMVETLTEMAAAPLPVNRTLPPPPKNLSDLALRCLERMAVRGGNGGTGVLAHDLAVRRTQLAPALEELVEAGMVTCTPSLDSRIFSMTDEGEDALLAWMASTAELSSPTAVPEEEGPPGMRR
jgi:hypothetical protein